MVVLLVTLWCICHLPGVGLLLGLTVDWVFFPSDWALSGVDLCDLLGALALFNTSVLFHCHCFDLRGTYRRVKFFSYTSWRGLMFHHSHALKDYLSQFTKSVTSHPVREPLNLCRGGGGGSKD